MHCLTSAGRSLRAAQSGAALGAVVAESAEIAVGASIFSQVHFVFGGSCQVAAGFFMIFHMILD